MNIIENLATNFLWDAKYALTGWLIDTAVWLMDHSGFFMHAVAWTGFILAVAFYFAPTLIAGSRRRRNSGAILALNLFLGWTLIGWVVALVWALTVDLEVSHV